MSSVRVRFLGSGDAFASGGRLQSTFLVEAEGRSLLVDCGATGLVALARGGVSTAEIDAIAVTHLHGDHFGGLPFVLLDAQHVAKRRTPLTIAGPAGLGERLAVLRRTLYPPDGDGGALSFALAIVELPLGTTTEVAGFPVTPLAARHPSGAPALMLRIAAGGRLLAFTGDTGWDADLTALAAGADLLVAECSTYDRPLPHHLDYVTLAARRAGLGCRRLVLTHCGPEVLRRAEAGELELEVAHDGLVVEV